MKLKNEYYLDRCGENRPTLVIAGDDDPDTEDVKLIVLESPVTVDVHMSLDSLRSLRSLITSALKDHDDVSKCPACGYTLKDVQFHGDHRICRMFPYFEYERAEQPESEAVNH